MTTRHLTASNHMLRFAAAICLVLSACQQAIEPQATEPQEGSDVSTTENFLSTRPGIGITAAGGVVIDGPACPEEIDPQAPETIRLAWTSPNIDVEQLATIGLETLDFGQPEYMVEAYVDSVNNSGGLNGRCVLLLQKIWNIVDTVNEHERICDELPRDEPVVFMGLAVYESDIACLTIAEQIPTIGMSTWLPDSEIAKSKGLLFVDHGSEEFMVSTAIDAAFQTGELTRDDLIAVLYQKNTSANSQVRTAAAVATDTAEGLGLKTVDPILVSQDFGQTGVLIWEQRVRLLESDLTEDEQDEADRIFNEDIPDAGLKQLLTKMQAYYLDTAESLKSTGVTAVVAAGTWSDMRRMMRAAEQVEWFPKWITSDIQPPPLVLTRTPERQALNLVQVSSERAAGDEIPEMDRQCISLRNTAPNAPTFAHRPHTDAWNLTLNICNYLDIVFSAMSRVEGAITKEALLQELQNTDYQTPQGSHIKFSADDPYGTDVFRILKTDSDCLFGEWGCMRAATKWTDVTTVYVPNTSTDVAAQ